MSLLGPIAFSLLFSKGGLGLTCLLGLRAGKVDLTGEEESGSELSEDGVDDDGEDDDDCEEGQV